MVENDAARAADVARDYYDTKDVDGFYAQAWGGEDIHVGVYEHAREPIGTASRRTIDRMAARVGDALGPDSTVLDLGSGYGGAARRLAAEFGCRVVALNISETQNRRHRELNARHGLTDLIEVVPGSFQDIPAPAGSFDLVWSQEALCHSADRLGVLREAHRVLRPGGHLTFTDIMAAEHAPADALRSIAERLSLPPFATAARYDEQLRALAFTEVEFDDLTDHIRTHYDRLAEALHTPAPALLDAVSAAYVDTLRTSLAHTAEACHAGHFTWGIFHGRRD
ncbi:SAM-dependent methyltransferase [Streptomyces atriruber]|uniref:SAM-dependent methyltransferase n=1 Tax=Streptomyces atriruber TaxID=545121 RepID=UPI0006E3FCBD|nr:class I SAM-dependent methyltransferase [Streptomyces atriruber]